MYSQLATLRAYLGIAADLTGDNALLTRLLAVAQAEIDRTTGRTFEATADTVRYFDPTVDVADGRLWLRSDLAVLTSITNDGAVVDSTQYTTQPRTAGPFYAIDVRRATGFVWSWTTDPVDAIAVTGRWAYSVSAPADIEQATLRLAAYFYRLKDAQVFGITGDPASGQLIVPPGMPVDVMFMLRSYIRRSL